MACITRLQLFLLLAYTAAATAQSQVSNTTLGTQFSVVQGDDQLLVWEFVADTLVTNTVQNDSFFTPDPVGLPSTCGDRLWRCQPHLFEDTQSSKAVLVAPLPNGVGLSLYDGINSDNFTFIGEYLAVPQEQNINCSFTSFTATTNHRLLVSCLKFTPLVEFEVSMWLYEVHVDFQALNETVLQLLNVVDMPYLSYSTGLSPIFFYDRDNDGSLHIIWFDDEVLFVAPLDSPHHKPEKYFTDTEGHVCFGNNVSFVRQSENKERLLVYCSKNTAIEVDVKSRGGGNAPFERSNIRFYCTDEWERPYLEERNGTLVLVSEGLADHVIPHPLNLSEIYAGDCVVNGSDIWFIGSSRNGVIVLTNVLKNQTTILATDAIVNHQVADGRILLVSNLSSSAILALSCSSAFLTQNQSFLLTIFKANENFSCPAPEEQPQPISTPTTVSNVTTTEPPTGNSTEEVSNKTTIAIAIPTVLVCFIAIVSISIIILVVCYLRSGTRGRGSSNRRLAEQFATAIVSTESSQETHNTVLLVSATSLRELSQPRTHSKNATRNDLSAAAARCVPASNEVGTLHDSNTHPVNTKPIPVKDQ